MWQFIAILIFVLTAVGRIDGQFVVAAAPNLGLNALTPASQVLLDEEGNRICSEIRSNFTPDQIVQDIESGLLGLAVIR